MKLLITAGSSYLGQFLVPLALREHDLLYTTFSHDPLGLPQNRLLDVRDSVAVEQLIADFLPDAVIHLAGSNRNPDVDRVIVAGAENVARSAESHHARLIHISTDVLFDGTAAPYTESAEPSPIHDYGRAKATAEKLIAQYHTNYVIIRTSLIYSLHRIDVGTQWMKTAIADGQTITLFDNHYRNPVVAEQLAAACLELATLDYCGILNVAGNQQLTRAEFALKLLDHWQIGRENTVVAADTTGRFPHDCRLDITLAKQLLQTSLWGVDEAFEQYHSA